MVSGEAEDGPWGPFANSSSNDPTSPTYNPDAPASDPNLSGSNVMPPRWTVPAMHKLVQQSKHYPNTLTPVPWYARYLGWSECARDKNVVAMVNRLQTFIGRSLTPVEAEAVFSYTPLAYQYLYNSEAFCICSFIGLANLRRPGMQRNIWVALLGVCISTYRVIYGYLGILLGRTFGPHLACYKMRELSEDDPNMIGLMADSFKRVSADVLEILDQRRRKGGSITPTREEITPSDSEQAGWLAQNEAQEDFDSTLEKDLSVYPKSLSKRSFYVHVLTKLVSFLS